MTIDRSENVKICFLSKEISPSLRRVRRYRNVTHKTGFSIVTWKITFTMVEFSIKIPLLDPR